MAALRVLGWLLGALGEQVLARPRDDSGAATLLATGQLVEAGLAGDEIGTKHVLSPVSSGAYDSGEHANRVFAIRDEAASNLAALHQRFVVWPVQRVAFPMSPDRRRTDYAPDARPREPQSGSEGPLPP
jgi:hypothetical protein